MLVNWAEIFIAKIVPELSNGDAEAELGLQRGSSTAPGFQESFGCSQAASLLWALWDANRNANNGLEFFKNSNNLPTYRTFRFLLEKKWFFSPSLPWDGNNWARLSWFPTRHQGSSSSVWTDSTLWAATTLASLPKALFLESWFFSLTATYSLALPPRLWLLQAAAPFLSRHKRGLCSPFTHPHDQDFCLRL